MITAIVGGQYGSEGKGVLAARLAPQFHAAVRVGGPNAGHTFWYAGQIWKMRQIPCAWINPSCDLFIGAGGVIDPRVLADEAKRTGRLPYIDKNAVVIRPEYRELEREIVDSIGSTGEGVGIARQAKAAREGDALLAREAYEHSAIDTVQALYAHLTFGHKVMLEGTQGSGLSLHHGKYPHVTSEDTNVAQLLANAGLAPDWLQHTLLVVRTYPIRVGGPSGPLHEEVDWREIPGAPKPETTTVTGRQRRIGKWDQNLFRRSIWLNQPCGVVLNFADYMDPDIDQKTGPHEWNDELRELIFRIEQEAPVVLVGVGGEQFSMVTYHRCDHGVTW